MKASEILTEAKQCCVDYMDYQASTENKGVVRIRLSEDPERNGDEVKLHLLSDAAFPESMFLRIDGELISRDAVIFRSYDNKNYVMTVQDTQGYLNGVLKEKVILEADLSYLTQNLCNWIESVDQLYLPMPPQDPVTLVATTRASKEQLDAVRCTLESGISYIWGCPGSGKTSTVMVSSILSELCAGHRILITAPTNASLDNALICALEELQNYVSLDRILRLGMPSEKLREAFPSVCEDFEAAKRYHNLQDEMVFAREDSDYHAFLSREAEKLVPRLTTNRIVQASIVAVTVDSYVSRLLNESKPLAFTPDHIYLDEAAYCSLIKALPLISGNIPLTMLGDHMQLQPVCCIPTHCLAMNHRFCLWSQPAVLLPFLFTDNIETLFYKSAKDAVRQSSKMTVSVLNQSFRYGNAISSVLNDAVYHNGLTGYSTSQTKIVIINAPFRGRLYSHIHEDDAYLIERYLQDHESGDFAVLTPYVKQANLIKKQLRTIEKSRIMTIHAAQSREWDTVFLSIPETTDHFLSDSTNRQVHALELLNTAVSRAKEMLVVVCDLVYWMKQDDQFLCKLIHCADQII